MEAARKARGGEPFAGFQEGIESDRLRAGTPAIHGAKNLHCIHLTVHRRLSGLSKGKSQLEFIVRPTSGWVADKL